jgi:probable FeS assembly SUF system protein SufT
MRGNLHEEFGRRGPGPPPIRDRAAAPAVGAFIPCAYDVRTSLLGPRYNGRPSTPWPPCPGASLPAVYSRSSEPVRFERDCEAVLVPQGESVTLPAGSVGYITQALGGSWTVFVEGNLMRIAGKDADAIGKEPPPPIELPEGASDDEVETLVWAQLRTCFDPEIPINIVDLGLVYEVAVQRREAGDRRVEVRMTLTAPACGMGEILVDDVRGKVELIPTVAEADVELVFDPPWNRSMMSEVARLETGMF